MLVWFLLAALCVVMIIAGLRYHIQLRRDRELLLRASSGTGRDKLIDRGATPITDRSGCHGNAPKKGGPHEW